VFIVGSYGGIPRPFYRTVVKEEVSASFNYKGVKIEYKPVAFHEPYQVYRFERHE